MEGRLAPEKKPLRPEGLIADLDFVIARVRQAVDELEKAGRVAASHSRAAVTQIRGGTAQLYNAIEAIEQSKRSLRQGTTPIAEGLKKSARRPI